MDKLKIGAQLYTVRDFMKTPEEMAASLKKIHSIGFETVQVSGIGPVDWERDLAAMLKENQLTCVATMSPLTEWNRIWSSWYGNIRRWAAP